jgi:hypothetical protein
MNGEIDPEWMEVLDAIEQLRSRGESATSDNLSASVPLLDQMINGRWITGVVIRSKSTPWKERIIGINLTPLGRQKLDEQKKGIRNQPEN